MTPQRQGGKGWHSALELQGEIRHNLQDAYDAGLIDHAEYDSAEKRAFGQFCGVSLLKGNMVVYAPLDVGLDCCEFLLLGFLCFGFVFACFEIFTHCKGGGCTFTLMRKRLVWYCLDGHHRRRKHLLMMFGGCWM